MKDISNSRADLVVWKLKGPEIQLKSLPSVDASHNHWLEFFMDKYERRRWTGGDGRAEER